ncbi:uncharacterized protein BHQ10_002498 [Talaromyces amestolkiae]|uniref:Uncharacterized protein n=1 Tax=Talaromyces amestolkiae TaxID=1196081 RepID=A0A364KSG0_TALAM|nr:uncharacterized protein BHQ10_002498 [Talaromyces amestolkiae]RAO66486.1 hypothetical protein BHQ10_002498 [Talaromyces amestolkiae]
MDMITNLYRRACDESDPNSAACAKPTSQILLNAVPAAIVGAMLVIAGIVFFFIARKRRRQFVAEAAKERESFEIEIYEPTANNRNRNHNPAAYADPFNDPHGLSRDPDYNEFSLAPPQSRRDHSPSRSSVATESTYAPHPDMSAPPPAYHEGSVGASVRRPSDNKPFLTYCELMKTEMRVAEPYWLQRQMSRHIEQSDSDENNSSGTTTSSDSKRPPIPRLSPKSRSLSDAAKHGALQPSALRDFPPSSKDDIGLTHTTTNKTNSPSTPQKTSQPRLSTLNGLSLQLPPQSTPSFSTPSANRIPLSPKLDAAPIYGSPASAIPRRSRGLDFARACTNLHHSTLAESSPDSSPNVGGRGVNIPQRRGGTSSAFGSPGTSLTQPSGIGSANQTTMSSSLSSVNMLESDTSSSEEDDDEPMNGDRDEMMITTTPQASKMHNGFLSNPFGGAVPSPGNDWMGTYSSAATSLASFQRARFRKSRNSRHSSSSASGNSNKPSPGPLSPPVLKSIEVSNGGYFAREMSKSALQSRRESLSLGTGDLQLSDLSDDGEARAFRADSPGANAETGPRGVVRRAVTRRGNLLPKTKTFARIRAALMEESAPLDTEAKKEAEVIRQVRESDPSETKAPSFPLEQLEELTSTTSVSENPSRSVPETAFSNQASLNSGGTKFWETFDGRYRTPPPPGRLSTQSSVMSEDTNMDTPVSNIGREGRWRSPTPQAVTSALATEIRRKRRRDDGFDAESFKRRAVSPGMSVQSSPVLQSTAKDSNGLNGSWIIPSKAASALLTEQTHSSSSNSTPTGIKRIGLQGINETHDGLMNMSIE